MDEIWRPVAIPEYAAYYQVSTLGSVRSLDRRIPANRQRPGYVKRGRILTPNDSSGYPAVTLCLDGVPLLRTVHFLILEAFLGQPPEGYKPLHIDGDMQNNELANLRWASPEEIHADRIRRGVASLGTQNSAAKLDDEQVREIFIRHWEGCESQRLLAREFKISQSTVSLLVRKKRWKHITENM